MTFYVREGLGQGIHNNTVRSRLTVRPIAFNCAGRCFVDRAKLRRRRRARLVLAAAIASTLVVPAWFKARQLSCRQPGGAVLALGMGASVRRSAGACCPSASRSIPSTPSRASSTVYRDATAAEESRACGAVGGCCLQLIAGPIISRYKGHRTESSRGLLVSLIDFV